MRPTSLFSLTALAASLAITGRALAAEEHPAPSTAALGAKLEVVHEEKGRFFEGPSYDPGSDALYFTAFGKGPSQILKLGPEGSVSVFLDRTEGINGTFLSRRGGLIGCQGERGRVVWIPIEPSGRPGELKVLAESCEGRPFLKPNDLAEDARGGIYFTDPDFKDKQSSGVYYITPEGKSVSLISDMKAPNGIYVGKDGLTLHVADSADRNIRVYPIDPVTGLRPTNRQTGRPAEGKVFFDPPTENRNPPDGMTMDEHGNLYFAARGGIWVAAPDGKNLGHIPIPEFCSNATFGGKDGRTLFMTCQDRVYRLQMKVRGWEFASRHEFSGKEPLKFKQVALDKAFRSEGVAIADVNRDGKQDILAGEVWYEAPHWTVREVAQPGKYDGAAGYSQSFACFADDWTADGFPDLLVIPFPGAKAHWYENPRGKPERWKQHDLWHSACNETPLYADLLGNGKRQLVMAWQPEGKENEGIMGYFTPPAGGEGKWDSHPISPPKAPGTFKFSHGLGVGDVNGDGRNDVIITEGWWEQPEGAAFHKGHWRFHEAPFGPAAADLHAYDLNGDGLNDVISSSAHAYGIWWREQVRGADGKSEWRQHLIDASFSQSHALHLVDLTGDGVKDLVTGKRYFAHQGHDPGEFEPIVLYLIEVKKGSPPSFSLHLLDLGVGIATQFAIGDVNGDGLPDIAVGNKRGVHVLIQEGKPRS